MRVCVCVLDVLGCAVNVHTEVQTSALAVFGLFTSVCICIVSVCLPGGHSFVRGLDGRWMESGGIFYPIQFN